MSSVQSVTTPCVSAMHRRCSIISGPWCCIWIIALYCAVYILVIRPVCVGPVPLSGGWKCLTASISQEGGLTDLRCVYGCTYVRVWGYVHTYMSTCMGGFPCVHAHQYSPFRVSCTIRTFHSHCTAGSQGVHYREGVPL